MRLLAFLAFALIATSSGAAPQERLQRTLQIANVCGQAAIAGRSTREALNGSGMRSEGLQGGVWIYSDEGRRVVAAVPNGADGCIVLTHEMTEAEGRATGERLASTYIDRRADGARNGRFIEQWGGATADDRVFVIGLLNASGFRIRGLRGHGMAVFLQ